jgi:hypothetical protein
LKRKKTALEEIRDREQAKGDLTAKGTVRKETNVI